MRNSDRNLTSRQSSPPRVGARLKAAFCGLAVCAALAGAGAASAGNYNETTQGDLSNNPKAPTNLGVLTLGSNTIIGTTIPSGMVIDDHGALANQDNDFFTFTIPTGEVLTGFNLGSDTSITSGDRFFLGLYQGASAPVDPSAPTPAGLYGYTLPGTAQIGTNLLPAIATSSEPGFPGPLNNFSGPLTAGTYTVWLVDGDRPVSYDLNLVVAAAPEPGAWALMIAGLGLMGFVLRRRQSGVGESTPFKAA